MREESFGVKDEFEIEDAEVIFVSDQAIKIDAPFFDREVFVPKSVISKSSDIDQEGHGKGSLIVEMWFAEKVGWTE